MPSDVTPTTPTLRTTSTLLRALLLCAGVLATAFGVLGIFLPLLPTVPLLLLAAACFARSSERCYRWLLTHRHLGPIVSAYLDGGGIPLRAKVSTIVLLWLTVSASALLLAHALAAKLILLAVGAGVTLYLLRLPTRQ